MSPSREHACILGGGEDTIKQTWSAAWAGQTARQIRPDEQVVRNKRYSYMEFKKGPVAIYDLENDPWEIVNLANDPGTRRSEAKWRPC